MSNILKLSRFNYFSSNENDDLLVYNFLNGLSSLTIVKKDVADEFKKRYLSNIEELENSCQMYTYTTELLTNAGILIGSNEDEFALYDSLYYEDALSSKLNLFILPTGKCNFNCTYCFESMEPFFRNTMTQDAQKTLVKFLQRNIRNYTEVHISWFGGEPLLAASIINNLSDCFIQICSKRLLPYSAEITTNGFLLDIDMFDMLYNNKVYDFMVTIDGFREHHNKQRVTHDGAGTYDVIMTNLIEIYKHKEYKFAHIRIRVNITKNLLNDLDNFISYIDNTFGDDSRFSFQFSTVINFSGSDLPDNLYANSGDVISRLMKNTTYVHKYYSESQKLIAIDPGQRCIASKKNAFVIAPDLSLYKCYSHYELKANKIGQIKDNGDLQINVALHRKWYLKNEFTQQIPESCQRCFYLPSCHYGNKVCPVRYIKDNCCRQPCPLESAYFRSKIDETIKYAAEHGPCRIISVIE